MPIKHLAIDGKNTLYRAIYATRGDSYIGRRDDPFVVILKFIHNYYSEFQPESIHIFWDLHRQNIWRKQVFPEYKEHRNESKIANELKKYMRICIQSFRYMRFRQYISDQMEADDLIYAFCRVNLGSKIVIVSSDSDFDQISYRFKNIQIYNPLNKKSNKEFSYDPAIHKALTGDKSDNISGYYLIGKKRATTLCKDVGARVKFLNSNKACVIENGVKQNVGESLFQRNLSLIDLSLCPDLQKNMDYVSRQQTTEIKMSLRRIREILCKDNLGNTLNSINRYISKFKKLK